MIFHIVIFRDSKSLGQAGLPSEVEAYFTQKLSSEGNSAKVLLPNAQYYAEKVNENIDGKELERLRKRGSDLCKEANAGKFTQVDIVNVDVAADAALALSEGMWLSNYKFDKYVKDDSGRLYVKDLLLKGAGSEGIAEMKTIANSVFKARNLVNEPVNHLNAEGLASAFEGLGAEAGFSVEVWNEAKISSQKMGGLLAVNAGSQDPPTFSIMEYKAANAVNDKPIVLVGKGVVFDTGGLSLKPTPASMDHMKCDMAGSAVVAGVMHAVATLKMPLWLIALVPSTDNRPGENAICPGDIISMYDGTTVEILNTDAEGRLILADALAFAKKYKPELVLDFATLTGAAARALGTYGSALMGTADSTVVEKVKAAGEKVYERLAELPLWEEYFEDTKGDISDLKNLGKAEGGAQSAAMFLRHFTDYPWLHFDIAGTAFLHGADGYRPKGGTGVGVRLIVEFLKNRVHGK